MSADDRTQALLEIDFCRSRLPFLWRKYESSSAELRPTYADLIGAALSMLDLAVSRLLALEGLEPLPSVKGREDRSDH